MTEAQACGCRLGGSSGEHQASPGQRWEEAAFAILKQRLLLHWLDEVPNPATHILVMHAAKGAATLAHMTGLPLLVFPCLFEERTSEVLEDERRQARAYWMSLEAA